MMDAKFQFAHEVAGGDGPVQVIDQAGHERAVHDDWCAVRDVQGPDVLADRVGRLVVMNLPLDLMGAEAEAVGHDAEDDQDGEEIPLAVPDPGRGQGADEERRYKQAAMGQEVGDGQEIRVHEVDDARCREQQAEDGVDEKTVAEPAPLVTTPFDGCGQEDRQGQPAGQDIRRQFRIGNAVEDVNQAGPEGKQQQVLFVPQGAGLAENPVLTEERRQKARPGHEAGDEDGDEVVPGMEAFVHLRGEAQEVFADEEKIEEIRIPLADEVVPGHGDDQKKEDARHVKELQEEARPPAEEGIPKEDAKGEDDGNQAFRQHAAAHGRVEEKQELLVSRTLEEVKGDEAGVDEKGNGHVEDADGRNNQLQGRCRQDDGRQEPRTLVVHSPAEEICQKNITQACKGRQDASCEFLNAEELHRQRRDPVLENGLFEIRHVVEMRRHIIAGKDHFRGHSVITPFIELNQMIRPDMGQVQKDRRRCQKSQTKTRMMTKSLNHREPPVYESDLLLL